MGAVGNRFQSWRWRAYAWSRIGLASCERVCFFASSEGFFSCCLMRRHQFFATSPNVYRPLSAPRIIQGAPALRGCVGGCLVFSHVPVVRLAPVPVCIDSLTNSRREHWWIVHHLILSTTPHFLLFSFPPFLVLPCGSLCLLG